MILRNASPSDAPILRAIYAPYVENTAISFELVPPSAEEFTARITRTLERYPYLIAEEDGKVLGYLYAGAFRVRPAYAVSAETSIYLLPEARRRGIGRALYEAVFPKLRALGITRVYACIACPPEEEDEHLTFDSIRFHTAIGFREVGHFHGCARKFGKEYDMVYMEYRL